VSASRRPSRFLIARVLRKSVAYIVAGVYRTKVVGAENFPQGGSILAGNHVSYGDPVLLWCRSPRPVHFMAKAELWGNPLFGWALDQVLAFPVRRGTADREALQFASGLLKEGEFVGVFPEGTRSTEGESEGHGGAAFLAIRNNVPVTPIGIAGTDRILPPGARFPRFPKVVISVGTPIDPASFGDKSRKERVEAMTAEIMRRMREQVVHAREVAAG